MASYEPLNAIIDVPTVQEARSGEFNRVKSVELLMCCVDIDVYDMMFNDPHSTDISSSTLLASKYIKSQCEAVGFDVSWLV